MTAAAFLAAAALGVPVGVALGLVGGGGSILAVPILIGVLGLEPRAATGASLVIVAANALAALRAYLREGLVDARLAVTVTALGIGGSFAGTAVNHLIAPRALTLAFAALMLVVAASLLGRSRRGSSGDAPPAARPGLARTAAIGTVVGFTTGLFGVGGGFVIVPGLLALGLPMRRAVPTSLLVIVLNSLVALAARVASGAAVPIGYAVPMVLGGAIGSSVAAAIAPRLGNAGLSRAFAALVAMLAVYMAAVGLGA